MSIAELQNVSFRYPDSDRPVFDGISTRIAEGAFLLVEGPSGSGKSTFLRLLNGLVPHFSGGTLEGNLRVVHRDPVAKGPRGMADVVAFVFQNPESQFVLRRVEEELAFGMENLGIPRHEMAKRIDEISQQLGLMDLLSRDVHTLSGGEKQKVALASVLIVRPRILLLDEPLSQLDEMGAAMFVSSLQLLKERSDLTIVCAEHRHQALSSLATDRLVLERPISLPQRHRGTNTRANSAQTTSLRLSGISVERSGRSVLRSVSFEVAKGESIGVVGPNGSGKSTLLHLLAGVWKPDSGKLETFGSTGLVPQLPNILFSQETLAEELALTRSCRGGVPSPSSDRALLEELGLAKYANTHPHDLSVGEQLRAAIATILAGEPDILLLDEPTRGLDDIQRTRLIELLLHLQASGATIVMATHDRDLLASVAQRTFRIDREEIVIEESSDTRKVGQA